MSFSADYERELILGLLTAMFDGLIGYLNSFLSVITGVTDLVTSNY